MHHWEPTAQCPSKYMAKILKHNNTEFLVVLSTTAGDGIHKYNIKNNQWNKIIGYNKDLRSTSQSVAFDELNKLIYVCDDEHQLLEFNLNSKSMQILSNNRNHDGWIKIFCVNGIIHLLGDENKHYIFDKHKKTLTQIHQLNIDIYNFMGNLLHLKSKKSMILFERKNGSIHEFELQNNKWIKYNCKSEENIDLIFPAVVCTENEQHIIMFAGMQCVSGYESTDSIFVFDVENRMFMKSRLKCPFKGMCQAIIMRDEYKDELMVFGFVNQCFACKQFVNMQKLPFYIVRLINKWVCNEWIYLIKWANGNHWKIHIDYIMQSIN